jgi:hypothetical protein
MRADATTRNQVVAIGERILLIESSIVPYLANAWRRYWCVSAPSSLSLDPAGVLPWRLKVRDQEAVRDAAGDALATCSWRRGTATLARPGRHGAPRELQR